MDHSSATRISVTPSIPRQTPKTDFGQVLSNTVNGVMSVGGALMGSLPGMPIISSAVSAVSALANSGRGSNGMAASGVVNIGSGAGGQVAGAGGSAGAGYGSTVTGGAARSAATAGVEPSGMTDMISSMRAEADRSMMMQMQMQTESREYNALTNIIKLRHDSAKAAINNIR
jgi:hypothetical protein